MPEGSLRRLQRNEEKEPNNKDQSSTIIFINCTVIYTEKRGGRPSPAAARLPKRQSNAYMLLPLLQQQQQ